MALAVAGIISGVGAIASAGASAYQTTKASQAAKEANRPKAPGQETRDYVPPEIGSGTPKGADIGLSRGTQPGENWDPLDPELMKKPMGPSYSPNAITGSGPIGSPSPPVSSNPFGGGGGVVSSTPITSANGMPEAGGAFGGVAGSTTTSGGAGGTGLPTEAIGGAAMGVLSAVASAAPAVIAATQKPKDPPVPAPSLSGGPYQAPALNDSSSAAMLQQLLQRYSGSRRGVL
jgi:hypothetical protein